MMSNIRKAERTAYCRLCDKQINRGEEMYSFWSYRNTGMWIHLHLECVKYMNNEIFAHDLTTETQEEDNES